MVVLQSFLYFFTAITLTRGLTAENDLQTRIISGINAPDGGAPYHVSLRMKTGKGYGNSFCEGAIIKKKWILTAASCVVEVDAEKIVALLGTDDLSSNGTYVQYGINLIVPHYYYNPETLSNDISLLRVAREIEFSEHIQPIKLAVYEDSFDFAKFVLTGWGVIDNKGRRPKRLQYIVMDNVPLSDCQEKFRGVIPITREYLCAQGYNKTGGACRGDSGSPLMKFIDNTLAGILTGRTTCADGKIEIFVRVSAYEEWIDFETYANREDLSKDE